MASTVQLSLVAYDSASLPVECGVTLSESILLTLAEANGSNQANVIYGADINLIASGNQELDLQTALDAYGVALTLTDVALLWLSAPATNGDDIIVTQGASNGFSSLIEDGATGGGGFRIAPGATIIVTGFAVGEYPVSGTIKTLDFTNADGAGAADVEVRILGRRA